ncbi:MAG: hypothetical protein JKY55_17975 [Aliivibrio sp.]|uniref:hypothetical protein n=1 Tax=Aliivibrio sp. TaxID=1872443 RepID=UPI001A615519|nr:hypothetical protein [Aliivibrio sp.]
MNRWLVIPIIAVLIAASMLTTGLLSAMIDLSAFLLLLWTLAKYKKSELRENNQ